MERNIPAAPGGRALSVIEIIVGDFAGSLDCLVRAQPWPARRAASGGEREECDGIQAEIGAVTHSPYFLSSLVIGQQSVRRSPIG